MLQILPVPLNGFSQSCLEIILRMVTQQSFSLRYIGVAVLDITLPIRTKLRLYVFTESGS
mgnify:CR=1 FL=1